MGPKPTMKSESIRELWHVLYYAYQGRRRARRDLENASKALAFAATVSVGAIAGAAATMSYLPAWFTLPLTCAIAVLVGMGLVRAFRLRKQMRAEVMRCS